MSIESDSIVGSCDCMTKTPEVKHHKPGCRYRLICERDEAREELAVCKASKKRILKRAEAIRCELVELHKRLTQ